MNDDDPHDSRPWAPIRPREQKKQPGSSALPALLVIVSLLALIVAVGVIWSAVTGGL
jgi:hypothetical protein